MDHTIIEMSIDQGCFHYICGACGHKWDFVFPHSRRVAKIMCICGTSHRYEFTHIQEKEK